MWGAGIEGQHRKANVKEHRTMVWEKNKIYLADIRNFKRLHQSRSTFISIRIRSIKGKGSFRASSQSE